MRCRQAFRILDVGSSIRAPGRSPESRSRQLAGPGCAVGIPDPRRRPHGQRRQADLRSPGAGSSPALDVLQPSGSSAPVARSEHQGALRILGTGNTVRPPGKISEAQEQAARPSWVCCRPFRIFGACRPVRAPGRSPKHVSRQLAGPGCAAASRIFAVGRTVRPYRKISETQEQTARRPWMRCRHSGSSTSAARSEHQADLRSPEAGSSPLLGVLQPSGSSAPVAQSEHPADPRNPGAGSPATWMRCRPFRILGAGSSIRAPGRSPNPRSGQLSNLVCHE